MRQTKPFLAKHKWDVILLSALCLLSLLGLLLARLVRTDGQYVVVTHNHEIVGKYDLSKDQTIPLSVGIDLYNDDDDHTIQIQQLYDRINRLEPFDRAIILLWLENMTYQEIANVVGITLSNVTTRLFRIKEQLKAMSNKK